MRLKYFKKRLALILSLATVLTSTGYCVPQFAAAEGTETSQNNHYTGYKDGVTVEADAGSSTGYTATFIYKQLDSYSGLSGDIAKVELYSDCFYLFKYSENTEGTLNAETKHTPDQFSVGMYPGGGNSDTTDYIEMTKLGNGRWGAKVPLSSGAFVYNFRVTDTAGNQASRLDDPSNPTIQNTATGIHSLSSMVYVPYNASKMGIGKYSDRSVELPQTNGKKGKVETVAYTGAAGDKRGLAIYLPYGYNVTRAEKYKVLYLSHGNSGDKVGNELRWMNEGCVANIMDNLSADFVVVTMNNQDLNWDYDKIWAEQKLIMAYAEKNYNVYNTAKGRAFAGLSMGGMTTSNMLMNHPDQFSYYGIWSYANTTGLTSEVKANLAKQKDRFHLFLASGEWDFGLQPVKNFEAGLDEVGVEYTQLVVPGAHDWETWQQIYAYAVKNFFWKADSPEMYTSDTTCDFSVNGAYTFKVTSKNGKVPAFVVGTSGVFDVTLAKVSGNDYFFKITAVGAPGAKAGIYINGANRLLTATVKSNQSFAKSDTTLPFCVKIGHSYTFKLTANTKPNFVAGSGKAFRTDFVKQSGHDYFFKVTAIGKSRDACGFYINGSKTPVSVATVA